MTYSELARRVREHIGQRHRYEHSVRVARFAERLALIHKQNTKKARIAGMLHDLARLYSPQRLLQECSDRGMLLSEYERAHPIVLHAPLSARIARESFGITDPDILSAIAKHTLGAAEMTPLDRILYIADSLEPGRDFAGRAELAALAERDLAEAMRRTAEESARYLQGKGIGQKTETEVTTGGNP